MELRYASQQIAAQNESLWTDIPGWEGLYAACKYGFILGKKSGKILRPAKIKGGYLTVALYRDKKGSSQYVHRLIAETFIPNTEGKPQVNHIGGKKNENHVALLEWATRLENNVHAIQTGLRTGKVTPAMIDQILAEHIRGDKHHGAAALAIKHGLDKCTIHQLLNKYKYGNRNTESNA